MLGINIFMIPVLKSDPAYLQNNISKSEQWMTEIWFCAFVSDISENITYGAKTFSLLTYHLVFQYRSFLKHKQ